MDCEIYDLIIFYAFSMMINLDTVELLFEWTALEKPLFFSKKYSVVLEMTVNFEFLANRGFFQTLFYMHVFNSMKSRDCQIIVCKLKDCNIF